MTQPPLASASFDPKVKQYWVLLWVLVSFITLFGIVLIPFVAALVWFISGRMLAAMSATLSEKKLVVKRGILVREEKSIPLDKITDVAMTQGPLMRLFNLQRLSFETAGQSGQGALVSLIGVVDASAFREAILAQKERLTDNHSTQAQPASALNELQLLANINETLVRIEQQLKSK